MSQHWGMSRYDPPQPLHDIKPSATKDLCIGMWVKEDLDGILQELKNKTKNYYKVDIKKLNN